MIEVIPTAGALGAEIYGLDLSGELSDTEFEALRQAWLDFEVVFFRDQAMTPESHASLANRFGSPQLHEAYPHVPGFPQITILENDEANPSKIEKWHTDMTFRQNPPLGSILHGVIIPARGGDTLFASMSAAYEGLSDSMQQFLSSLTAIHDFSHGFRESRCLSRRGGRPLETRTQTRNRRHRFVSPWQTPGSPVLKCQNQRWSGRSVTAKRQGCVLGLLRH